MTVSAGAPRTRRVAAQLSVETRLMLRRGENLLVTILIPAAVLLTFGTMQDPPAGYAHTSDFLLPGVVALAVISTGMVSLGISTAYERFYRVLKRLGVTPLTRLDLLAAKGGAVLAVELMQVAVLAGLAVAVLGWRPAATAWLAAPVLVLGTACFTGLGLLMAGALRAEATLALANALFLAFLALGGIVTSLDRYPGWLADLVRLLPATALAAALRSVLADGDAPGLLDLGVLIAWTAAVLLLTVRTFRWD